ncbi:Unknown protein [Striga hermonthica]|uniref:Uncharacterized protein n=1 Tax=Striga hermonthica TaxID=68872 RepID=A0A9N7MLF2_STRHE|nr:Unknown protein [Striga hermonthica]
MVGLLAWAADVVGGGGGRRSDDGKYPNSIPHAQEVDRKLASLNHSIQDLRLKLQPPDIPSASLTSTLTLQLNAHSVTKKQEKLQKADLLRRVNVNGHDLRFVKDNWEIPVGSHQLMPVSVEITYGLEDSYVVSGS